METTPNLSFINPATGEPFGNVAMTPLDQIPTILCEMRRAAPLWSEKSVHERIRILRQFQHLLIETQDEITALINQDCGKSRQDALIEVLVTVDILNESCRRAPRWLRRERVSSGLYLSKNCYVEHRPHGVVLVLSPWNYPLALALPQVLAALLAGNTVILKPSEVTAATGVLIESLFQRVPELTPFVRVVHGDGRAGAALISACPDFIHLTGSTATGRKVMQAAAEHLIPVACELGGKDAMLVLDDADVESAAQWGVWGAFFNAGQTCMSVERVYVAEPLYDEFVRLAIHYTELFKMGYTTDLNSPYSIGPITDPRQVKIVERHVADALEKGARIVAGGQQDGVFFSPTILVDVDHSMLLMQEETFGPLMPIMKMKNDEEGIQLANDSRFGLAGSIWSRDVQRAERVAKRIQAASFIINDTIAQFGIPMLPFGGVKESGAGRTHGREGVMQFTRPYGYAIGKPPLKWDIATVLREPGHYALGGLIMGLAFGVTLHQRWKALKQFPRLK